MEFLNRNKLPAFVPRLDLTAEELNQQADVLVAAINELAGRIYIMKDRIKYDERGQYSEEKNYPILDEMDRLAKELVRAFNEITNNHNYTKDNINALFNKYTSLERRLNALDDRVALKTDLNALIERVNYVRDHSLPSVGNDNNWYIGDINTGVKATGNSGVHMGNTEPTDPAVGVWIDTSDETTITVAEEVKF
jgi:hypothetical protein